MGSHLLPECPSGLAPLRPHSSLTEIPRNTANLYVPDFSAERQLSSLGLALPHVTVAFGFTIVRGLGSPPRVVFW